MELTYESIKNLIVEETWTGNQVKIKIQAKNQEQPIETVGVAMPSEEDVAKKMKLEMAKMAGSNIAVSAGANALGGLAGLSGVGHIVGSAASQMGVGYQMDMEKIMQVELTDEVKKQTILKAFTTLQAYYKFEDGEWIYAPV